MRGGGEKEAKLIGLRPYLCYVAISGLRFVLLQGPEKNNNAEKMSLLFCHDVIEIVF